MSTMTRRAQIESGELISMQNRTLQPTDGAFLIGFKVVPQIPLAYLTLVSSMRRWKKIFLRDFKE